RPTLPQGLAQLFEHPLTKMIFYALIVLVMTQNPQVAIVVAIAFYVLMSMLREQRIAEGFLEGLKTEGFFSQQQRAIEQFYAQQDDEDMTTGEPHQTVSQTTDSEPTQPTE